jgi:hypothetical protein
VDESESGPAPVETSTAVAAAQAGDDAASAELVQQREACAIADLPAVGQGDCWIDGAAEARGGTGQASVIGPECCVGGQQRRGGSCAST